MCGESVFENVQGDSSLYWAHSAAQPSQNMINTAFL